MAKTKTETKLPYVIIRTAAAGCFAGELASRKNLPAGTATAPATATASGSGDGSGYGRG